MLDDKRWFAKFVFEPSELSPGFVLEF